MRENGDYWHANPNKYGINKKQLNDRQKFKVDRDKLKKEYAIQNGFKIYYIWETEINNGIFDILMLIIKEYEYVIRKI